jgi:hypothetical protein
MQSNNTYQKVIAGPGPESFELGKPASASAATIIVSAQRLVMIK